MSESIRGRGHEGEVSIPGRGHAILEGAAEWSAIRSTGEIRSDAYPMNVELIKRIVALTSEDIFLRALFRGEVEVFVQELDRRLGVNAYTHIITLSDLGLWRETFRFIATAEKAISEGLLEGGRIKPEKPLSEDPVRAEVMAKLVSIAGPAASARLAASHGKDHDEFDRAVDGRLGLGAYMTIGALSDLCLWREILRFIAAAEAAKSGKPIDASN